MITETYGPSWKHATIHLLPDTMEMHSDGDHEVRTLIQNKIKDLEAELDKTVLDYNAASEAYDRRRSEILELEAKLAEAENTTEERISVWVRAFNKAEHKLKVAVRIIRELQAMDTVCHLDDHFEFLETVKDIK